MNCRQNCQGQHRNRRSRTGRLAPHRIGLVRVANEVKCQSINGDAIAIGALRTKGTWASRGDFAARSCTSTIDTNESSGAVDVLVAGFRDASLVDLRNVGSIRVADEVQTEELIGDTVLENIVRAHDEQP